MVRIMVTAHRFRLSAPDLRTDSGGGLAQLGERLAGSQKVRGSNPLSSTIFPFGRAVELRRGDATHSAASDAGRGSGGP